MIVFCGSFPALKRHFCDTAGRGGRTLLLAPSGRLLEHLESELLRSHGCVANVEMRTFLGLASALAAERAGGRRFCSDSAYYDFL
ncbi:MAG TPA: hypothetical protein PLL10_09340, partial [Elusimicrobiales bacterium]|nr:hypothetical protein [Elusimicrobiales bacterium]